MKKSGVEDMPSVSAISISKAKKDGKLEHLDATNPEHLKIVKKENYNIVTSSAAFYNYSMDKYDVLWKWLSQNSKQNELVLSFDSIEKILGFPIDHSFLNYKKNLLQYGFEVKKISLKSKEILIIKKTNK